MEIIKNQLIDELLEQHVQVIEYYYEVLLFEPLKMWSMLHKSISLRFPYIFRFVELCLCTPYSNALVEHFFNYLKIDKTDWRSRLNERNNESLLWIKVEGPDLKEFVEKVCANAVTLWWESKRRTTQGKCKNYKDRKTKPKWKRSTNTYIDEFLGNISSTDNGSSDLDGERIDSNIDMFID